MKFIQRKHLYEPYLEEMVFETAHEMVRKLHKKMEEDNYKGWDDPETLPILKCRFIRHASKDFTPENMIDVMNLAAMIRNQQI